MGKSESQAVGNAIAEQARRAAVDAEAKNQAARAALELRDEWVPRLYDAGYRNRQIAEILLISQARVHQILTRLG